MARIRMQNAQNLTMEDCFTLFLSATAAKGVKDKTLETYCNQFKSIAKRLNVMSFIQLLMRKQLDKMISVSIQNIFQIKIHTFTVQSLTIPLKRCYYMGIGLI